LILGAGATYADFPKRGRVWDRPPLDKGFFWNHRFLTHGNIMVNDLLINRLNDYFSRKYGHKISEQHSIYNSIEYVLKILYTDLHIMQSSVDADILLLELIKKINYLIASATNAININNRTNIVKLLMLLLEECGVENNLSVISLNYDIQIERALYYVATHTKYKKALSFPECYFLPNKSFITTSQKIKRMRAREILFSNKISGDPLMILKPHGSLNWFRMRPKEESLTKFFGKPPNKFRISRRYILPTDLTLNGKATLPIVIPPLVNKGSIARNTTIESIWAIINEVLKISDKIVVYGYSMPEADIEFKNNFTQAMSNTKRLKHIDIINPDINVFPRIMSLTNAIKGTYYRDIKAYI
jgi:hypothetical protein